MSGSANGRKGRVVVGVVGHGADRRLLDPAQDVRAQHRQQVEGSVEGGMQPAGGARQRRREREAARLDAAGGKQFAHAGQRHAAHVGVGRIVEHEVVPEHGAAGLRPAPHRLGQPALHGVVEQRREDGGLQHQVLARCRQLDGGRVAEFQPRRGGQPAPGLGVALGEQLDAGQALGREAEREQREQVGAAAAADLECAAGVEAVVPAVPVQQPCDRAFAFLRRPQRRRIEPVVAPVDGSATRIALADGSGFGCGCGFSESRRLRRRFGPPGHHAAGRRRLACAAGTAHRVSRANQARPEVAPESTSAQPSSEPMP